MMSTSTPTSTSGFVHFLSSPASLPPISINSYIPSMPHPSSQARAYRALRRAISLASSSSPLRHSLQVLANPLIYHSAHTHLDDATWQNTLNNLTTFADRVIQALNSHPDDNALSSLHHDAVRLHHTLDEKGFHTAFHPSHVSARTLFALRTCADSSQQTEADMRIVSTSLPATYQCLKQIFDTPVTLVDPIGTLSSIADHHRYNTPPTPSTIVPPLDTLQVHALKSSYDGFITKLNRVPIPETGRKRMQTFVDLLWQQSPIPEEKIEIEFNSSRFPMCDHLGSTDNSIVASALLRLSDNPSPDSPTLWTTTVAMKSLRLPSNSEHTRLSLQQETLRLKVLSHPCIPLFYGTVWPRVDGQKTNGHAQILHLVTERMTKSIQLGRRDPALRAFEVRIRILRDVADALRFLHAQQVFHGSLCPENVLIRVYDGRIYGCSKVDVTCLAAKALIGETRKHPLVYRAPECFSFKEKFFTSDVWSLGVLACFLLADSDGEENDCSFVRAVATRGKESSIAQAWARRIADDRARDLVIRCLHIQPERRPNAEEVYVDISGILRQKSVKADVATPAASPTRDNSYDSAHDSLRNCREPSENSHGNHRDILCRSLSDSDQGVRSFVNGKIPKTARGEGSGSREGRGASNSILGLNQNLLSSEARPCHGSGDMDDEGYGSLAPDISDETGLNDMFKFQVDETGKTRCIKRKASPGAIARPPKRPKLGQIQEKGGKPSDMTAGLREATMEEIFGPFSSSGSISGPGQSRVKSESALANECTAPKDVGTGAGNVTKVKVEQTVSNVGETNQPKDPFLHTRGKITDLASSVEKRADAKAEPRLELRLSDGPATGLASVATAQTSARKTSTSSKHEGRRQRVSRRERRRSKNSGVDNDNGAYHPTQSVETPQSTTWKGRIRKRITRPLKYADRSPSPAPSSSSRGADFNASDPLDNIFDIESNNSILGVHKALQVNKSSDKQTMGFREGPQALRDTSKRKKSSEKLSRSPPSAKQVNKQVDISLEFMKGAKEGESLLDFLDRQAKMGNTTAFVRKGILYEEGRHVKCDYGQAFNYYQRAAAAGNSEGQLRLARCYEDGRGVSKSESAATALFIQAADDDNAHAQFRAGVCFEEGRGVARDMKKALHYLGKSVEQRDPEACHKVAGVYREGKAVRKDDAKAFELFKIASDAGHVPSMVQQANMYAKGIGGVKRSIPKAVALYRRASDAGNPEAKLSLGLLHEDGQGVKKSSENALKLYKEAADLGHAPAMTALGQCFLWGYGIKQNFSRAVDLFRNAAKQGDSLAQHELGNCYKGGSGVEQDYARALYFYKTAAAQGSSVALVQYGEFLYSGHGIPQDYEKAFEIFQRAANLGAAEGYRWLGECYADGTGVQEDPKKAFQMYQKGAELGSSYAQTCLGVCYENGTGVEHSKTKALQWYRKAAAEGNHTAMNNLGIFYEQGRLVKRDPKRAVSYYQKAIDLGSVDAICNLADCYASGTGIERDMKMAVQHYQDAANHDMSGAKCELGVCYYYGRGVRQNFEKAMDLFKEASDSEPEALRHLGTGFYDGKGVERDYIAAIRLYKKAISRGNVDANYNLALCYSYGKGVSKDDKAAASFLEIAAAHGNRYAKLTLGNRYFEGRGVTRDCKKAVVLFSEAGEVDFTRPLIDDRIMSDEPQLTETKPSCT